MTERLVAHIMPYTRGDSAVAIILAALAGYVGIDLNVRTCRADDWQPWRPWRRVVVVVHWSKWWEHGYRVKPGAKVPRRKVERLRLAQVRDLQSVKGQHRILTALEAINLCADHGIVPCLEMKPSRWPVQVLARVIGHAKLHDLPVVFMTIQAYGRTARSRRRWQKAAHVRLSKVHNLGGVTMLLYRERVDWTWWGPVLDGIKGHRGHDHVVTAEKLLQRVKRENQT